MDTQTVIDIIKMIETQKTYYTKKFTNAEPTVSKEADGYFYNGLIQGITNLENHLLDYLEAQLNAEELKTGE